MKGFGRAVLVGAFAVAVAVGALAAVRGLGLPGRDVLGAAAGGLCLLWLAVLVAVPWNVWFRARAVAADAVESRGRGLAVPQQHGAEASRIARWALRAALAGHLGTTLLLVAVTLLSGRQVGWWFAAFALVSTGFRPLSAFLLALRARLAVLGREVRFPRDDAAEARARADRAATGVRELEARVEEQYRAQQETRRVLDALSASSFRRTEELDAKLDARVEALGRELEAVVDRLTENREIIAGVRAFVRMLRGEEPGAAR
ncbi:hypothetical protein BIV57_19710 [Mangrovactinospora gilvigrisea]|uniref:Uncharacterized protein n=1 Tax=Mangrovactinospora gilvigrisea TaxID=1428644 RepID=A0A1J7C833_9ACTN|nr:hypothetical protein [Mangrovactinospora gilvigrisea]OIV35802.1 hypothetical protein BIV57_19710 [Mangrovactinospora gilvigrisea]